MKDLMLGNEAVARGIYEAGCRLVFSYPGTPSTEITEYAAKYEDIYAEWSPNEKVALEAAFGASTVGARAFCGMKHVGLNVASDPMFTAVYTGVGGGLVIAVADDPGMHSSQNEQDTRAVAQAAKIPILEPADSEECKELTKRAFELSEELDLPVIIRLTTRVAHSRSLVEKSEVKSPVLKDYTKNVQKTVMVPANARGRRVDLEKRLAKALDYSENSGINTVTDGKDIGIIASGIARLYAKEGAPNGAGILDIRMVNPLPIKLIEDFSKKYSRIIVAEELDPVVENQCLAAGIKVEGKSLFPSYGEYTRRMISEKLGMEVADFNSFTESIPPRPPVLCAGCPHRGTFYVLRKLGVFVSGDIGCYTLGASLPLSSMDTCLCMGASVSGLHGTLKARPEWSDKAVAVIGDSTFMHSGITGLVDIVYNQSNATVLILDNRITGMTGHQHNPVTGYNAKGNEAPEIDLEALCRACGVKRVAVADPNDVFEFERILKDELQANEPSVVIVKRPCVLLKGVKRTSICRVNEQMCKDCKICISSGCPAISLHEGIAHIEPSSCAGCGVCMKICPFKAIEEDLI